MTVVSRRGSYRDTWVPDDAVKPIGDRTETVPIGQPQQYAEASGDRSLIHLDAEHARSHGLPGVILHGMTTLAYAARAVRMLADGDVTFLSGGRRTGHG